MSEQLECRITIINKTGCFSLGMFDPVSGRHEDLGTHPNNQRDKIIGDLKASILRVGHKLTFCERYES